jgi:hypothetical protein
MTGRLTPAGFRFSCYAEALQCAGISIENSSRFFRLAAVSLLSELPKCLL